MRLRRLLPVLAVCLAVSSSLLAASPNIVISQVYGGGGNAGATLKNDFIELYNRGTSSVNVTGWSVQYASSAGTTWQTTTLSGSIAPGKYYLVQEAVGAGGTTNLPTPDATGAIPMSATGGKVALVNASAALTGGCPTAGVVDFFGYDGANCFETAATNPLTNTTAAARNNGGCTDTDNNFADFTIGAPNPRNSATPATPPCTIVNNPPVINAPANPIAAVLSNAAPFNVSLSGSDDNNIFAWSATPGLGVSTVTVASGQGTANITYTVTLVSNFTGTATFTATLTDNVNTPVNQTVNITVTAAPVNNPPTITPPANPITTVEQNAPNFTVALNGNDDGGIYNWAASAGTGVSLVSVSAGQGTNHATFTVTLQGGFNGTAQFTASLSDNVNVPATTQLVNITVTPPPPPPTHLVISQVYGGGGNTGATYQNDYVEIYNPTASPVEVSGWTLQYQAAASTGNWSGLQPLGGTVGPGEYYLVSLASGGAVGAPLPAANIVGGPAAINMSATAGKIALVSNSDTLSNCPVSLNPNLVDLVGYGTTANCKEGSSTAPGASNTTALFRKNSGLTDTDVNGNDFVAAAPNPRRTAPIVEIGPFVVITDPNNNASAAPKDASITITFSEPVNVAGSWYNIVCPSGAHNSATTASTDGGATWVITPNVSFTPGEQCTVTLFAANITDVDNDDSNPNTDNLRPGNKVWSFTVSTGDPAPFGADPQIHLTMGNPTNAVADTNVPNNYLMMKPTYALSYNRDKGTPNWVSWHLATEWYGSLARIDTFRPDPAVPPSWYRVQAFDFFTTGFDRGHMTPNADRDNQNRIPINQETYLMSNMVPQAPDNNQGPWANMENALRALTDAGNELYIVSGPAGVGGTGSNGGVTTTLAGGHVTVPASTWKVVLVLPKADGNDIARVSATTRTIAVIMPNVQGIRNDDWNNYVVKVDDVEALTGYDFFSAVPTLVQKCIEAGLNGANPNCAENQSVSASEDTAKSITLNALSGNGAALTYTITQPPAHGTLSGSGANQTYTPFPDYNGNDSFTFSVGAGTTATATVSITVAEVNDAPVATDDAMTTDEDTPLTFPASTLAANDSRGPANESAQTLTVTAVTAGPSTHGSVMLNAGQIAYVPDHDFNGAASFSYHVCDNGLTAGLPDSKCTDGIVNITVNAVNDPPVLVTITAPSSVELGASVSFTAQATDVDGPSAVSYSLSLNAPAGATINATTGAFAWTPTESQVGPAFTFDVIASDGAANTTQTLTISVVDTTAPTLSDLTLSTTSIWPPNHQMVDVSVAYTVTDFSTTSCALTVASNEPIDGLGDGDTAPDWEIVDTHHVRVRAERGNKGNGRVYTINADCRDGFGNSSHKSATVSVPKNQGGRN